MAIGARRPSFGILDADVQNLPKSLKIADAFDVLGLVHLVNL